jgi:spore germination cell wall hydrolase CwlJ-like protein
VVNFTSRKNSDENCFVIGGKWKFHSVAGMVAAAALASGCTTQNAQQTGKLKPAAVTSQTTSGNYTYTPKDKECLERAMFFESNRSSQDGLVAVGTVVMNRLDAGKWGNSICSVVGQKGQFAPGVLSRPMKSSALPDVQAAADAVLKGKRNPKAKNSMFFHTAGLKFPYKNMHYTVVAGGNAFYEKRDRYNSAEIESREASQAIANAYIASIRTSGSGGTQVADAGTTSSTQTFGRVVSTPQPVQVAQADIAPQQMAFASEKTAVPADSPGQAMKNTLQAQQAAQTAPADVLAYQTPDSKSVDAIGQMLLAQDRPNALN